MSHRVLTTLVCTIHPSIHSLFEPMKRDDVASSTNDPYEPKVGNHTYNTCPLSIIHFPLSIINYPLSIPVKRVDVAPGADDPYEPKVGNQANAGKH